MMTLVESTVRVSVIILFTLAVAALMRRRSPALRHWILASGIIAAAFLPALQIVAPRWGASDAGISAPGVGPAAAAAATQRLIIAVHAVQSIAVADQTAGIARIAFRVWAAGVLVGLVVFGAALGR